MRKCTRKKKKKQEKNKTLKWSWQILDPLAVLKGLIEIKQKNKSLKYIYAHNFSGFDGILLLKHLVKYKNSKVKPLIFISFFFYK